LLDADGARLRLGFHARPIYRAALRRRSATTVLRGRLPTGQGRELGEGRRSLPSDDPAGEAPALDAACVNAAEHSGPERWGRRTAAGQTWAELTDDGAPFPPGSNRTSRHDKKYGSQPAENRGLKG